MQQLVIIIHILTAIVVISLILMQRGKGADVGAAFGSGASQTMFGSKGSFPFLCKVIGIFAGIFFATSIALNYFNASMIKKTNESVSPISMPESSPSPVSTDQVSQPIPMQQQSSDTVKENKKK